MNILFRPRFVRDLRAIIEYLDEHSTFASEIFLEELDVVLYEKIPKQPLRFQEFSKMPTVGKVFRRATFKKKWFVVYKVESNQITYISIFHSSRDISKMRFEY